MAASNSPETTPRLQGRRLRLHVYQEGFHFGQATENAAAGSGIAMAGVLHRKRNSESLSWIPKLLGSKSATEHRPAATTAETLTATQTPRTERFGEQAYLPLLPDSLFLQGLAMAEGEYGRRECLRVLFRRVVPASGDERYSSVLGHLV